MKIRPLAALALLLALAGAAAAQTTAPATQPSGIRSALGMNTNGVSDWDSSVPFIDEVKSARPFGSPTSPQAYDLPDSPTYDEWGWPQGDFGVYLVTGRLAWPGVHRIRCGGKVDSIKLQSSAGTITAPVYDPAVNVTTAEVTVPDGSNQLCLVFRGTQRNPADPAAGKGVQWVQVLAPGYSGPASDGTGPLTREYLAAWKPFGHARMMALNQTNSHPVSTWAERAKVQEAQWSSKRGVPWEVQIELCNRAGVAPWICVPHAADDEYVVALAQLVRSSLRDGDPVYVEDSNEVWNATLGAQYGANKSAAEAEVNAGDPNGYTLPVTSWNPKSGKDETLAAPGRDLWLWFRHARRTWHLTKIFRDVFGPEQAYRIRGVLGAQNSDDWRTSVTLGYIARQLGNPADLFYGTAIAPYVGSADTAFLKNPDATADQIAEYFRRECLASFTAPDGKPARHKKLNDHWGLKLLSYEGGGDLGQYNVAIPAKTAAMNDPRVGEGYGIYLSNAFERAGFSMFTPWLAGRYGRWGYFADTDDVRNLGTPRYKAASDAASKYRLADPVKPDPRDDQIKALTAENERLKLQREEVRSLADQLKAKAGEN